MFAPKFWEQKEILSVSWFCYMLKESGFKFFRQFFDKSAVKMSDCGLIPIGPIPISKRRIPDVEPVESTKCGVQALKAWMV